MPFTGHSFLFSPSVVRKLGHGLKKGALVEDVSLIEIVFSWVLCLTSWYILTFLKWLVSLRLGGCGEVCLLCTRRSPPSTHLQVLLGALERGLGIPLLRLYTHCRPLWDTFFPKAEAQILFIPRDRERA